MTDAGEPECSSAEGGRLVGCRALVLDDDDFSQKMARRALQLAGVSDVELASSGMEALTRLSREEARFDVVLCDLNMPSMDGIEFIRRLADSRFGGGVLLVSGVGSRLLRVAEELARARRLNVLGVLEKPVSSRALRGLLVGDAGLDSGALASQGVLTAALPPSVDDFRQALSSGEIFPVYQPKVNVLTGETVGVEALARWNRPGIGAVSPDVFVPMAESSGLIDDMTEVIMRRAFSQARAWRVRGRAINVAVNVAMHSLHALDFPDRVLGLIAETGLDPSAVTLEVTESQFMENDVACIESLLRLRLRQVELSIDDFGTRYASLSQLRTLPFTELKIDRTFVAGAGHDEKARAILESSVALGLKLGLKVVAEGVETLDDWHRVSETGCQMAQGYFISRPLPADQVLEWRMQRSG